MNPTPRATHPADRKTVPVFSTTRNRAEHITPTQHLRLRLMYAAVKEGLKLEPIAGYDLGTWPALAPLKKNERTAVLSEVVRLRAMKPEDQAHELLKLKLEGNIP